MISFAFSSPEHSPFTMLLANVLVTVFMTMEARRYRYFCVYRARVRMLEENFYVPLIRRSLESPMSDWREMVSRDLDAPKYKNTYMEALLFRLRRNYIWLYGIVLVTWFVKLFTQAIGNCMAVPGVGNVDHCGDEWRPEVETGAGAVGMHAWRSRTGSSGGRERPWNAARHSRVKTPALAGVP